MLGRALVDFVVWDWEAGEESLTVSTGAGLQERAGGRDEGHRLCHLRQQGEEAESPGIRALRRDHNHQTGQLLNAEYLQ